MLLTAAAAVCCSAAFGSCQANDPAHRGVIPRPLDYHPRAGGEGRCAVPVSQPAGEDRNQLLAVREPDLKSAERQRRQYLGVYFQRLIHRGASGAKREAHLR